jgi:DNA-binding LytR/AlgR family response regulator
VSFRCSGSTISLNYDEIIYIFYDKFFRKSIIVTNDEKYPVNMSLKKIKAKLKQNFCYSHKSCIINKNYIKKINKKTKKITFSNDVTVSFLSRKFLLEVK